MKLFIISLSLILFTGCTYTQFKDGYKAAKVVYKDARYVVYEVEKEKVRINSEGLGVQYHTATIKQE